MRPLVPTKCARVVRVVFGSEVVSNNWKEGVRIVIYVCIRLTSMSLYIEPETTAIERSTVHSATVASERFVAV